METFKRRQVVDFLVDELGYDAHLTPWGIYIDMPNFEDTGRAVIEWRVSERDLANLNGLRMPRGFVGGAPYAMDELRAALACCTAERGIMRGSSMRIEPA